MNSQLRNSQNSQGKNHESLNSLLNLGVLGVGPWAFIGSWELGVAELRSLRMTQPVDYDKIAGAYDARYERNDYSGVERILTGFVPRERGTDRARILEVGCGTGHWLRVLRDAQASCVGIDLSAGMLRVAKSTLTDAHLVRARAEALPAGDGRLARVFCVNALHHFTDPLAFIREARRVLEPGGGLLTFGLDPGSGRDRWWIYDYFPEALTADRRRYPATSRIREWMEAAGFSGCDTVEAQHAPRRLTIREAAERGFLDRASTSQLMVISDEAYERGLERLNRARRDGGDGVTLWSDLRIYATSSWVW